jgi:hypothetical protein
VCGRAPREGIRESVMGSRLQRSSPVAVHVSWHPSHCVDEGLDMGGCMHGSGPWTKHNNTALQLCGSMLAYAEVLSLG